MTSISPSKIIAGIPAFVFSPVFTLADLIENTFDPHLDLKEKVTEFSSKTAHDVKIELIYLKHQLPKPSQNLIETFFLLTNLDMSQFLKGSTVHIENDNGRFCSLLQDHPEAKPRRSTHAKLSYVISDPVFGECLFWKGEDGDTYVQLEKHSLLKSFLSFLLHVQDYLHYVLFEDNIGPYGTSSFTDQNPIHIFPG